MRRTTRKTVSGLVGRASRRHKRAPASPPAVWSGKALLMAKRPLPIWLRVLARVDFVAAVVLTVLAPLALLARAAQGGRAAELQMLLRYWRGSSLLMVTVYLLIGERRVAFPAGIAARLLIARALLKGPVAIEEDAWFRGWRRLAGGYCLGGAALTAPLLSGCFTNELPPFCRAYIEPTEEFGALLHPDIPRERLGKVGIAGLWAFLAGALIQALAERHR